MRIRFIGGEGAAAGSMTLLETEKANLLIGCGLSRSGGRATIRRNRRFLFDPSMIQAVVLTDGGPEHAGNLPTLVRAGFRGPIYGTPSTCGLCGPMLAGIAREQREQAEGMRGLFRGADPLFDAANVEAVLRQLVPVPIGENFRIGEGIKGLFHDADPLLGPAGVVMEVREWGRSKRFRFCEDTGALFQPLSAPDRAEETALFL